MLSLLRLLTPRHHPLRSHLQDAVPRVVIHPAMPDRESLDNEIARLRGLDVGELRAKWHTVFGRRAHPHPPRHLLFCILAYRLQTDKSSCERIAGCARRERPCRCAGEQRDEVAPPQVDHEAYSSRLSQPTT